MLRCEEVEGCPERLKLSELEEGDELVRSHTLTCRRYQVPVRQWHSPAGIVCVHAPSCKAGGLPCPARLLWSRPTCPHFIYGMASRATYKGARGSGRKGHQMIKSSRFTHTCAAPCKVCWELQVRLGCSADIMLRMRKGSLCWTPTRNRAPFGTQLIASTQTRSNDSRLGSCCCCCCVGWRHH
jgi:hypothetical protein